MHIVIQLSCFANKETVLDQSWGVTREGEHDWLIDIAKRNSSCSSELLSRQEPKECEGSRFLSSIQPKKLAQRFWKKINYNDKLL